MARLSNLYGASPIAQAPRHGGGGGGGGGANRPRNPNRGGGGGGGGGATRIPHTGLYQGDQGEAAANLDPEQFIRDLLANAGIMDQSGTAYSDWKNNQLVANLLSQYNATSHNGDQTMSPVDWALQQYGASFGQAGRHHHPGTPFTAGSLSDAALQAGGAN